MSDQEQPSTRVERTPQPEGAEPTGFADMPSGTKIRVGDRISGMQPGEGDPEHPRGPGEPTGPRLPGALAQALGTEHQTAKDFVTFTIPADCMGMGWNGADGLRVFSVIEATPEMEDRATAAAGIKQNFQASFRELLYMCIYKIDDQHVKRDNIIPWMRQIGPAARKLVEQAFHTVNSVEEPKAQMFLRSAQPGRG